MLEVLTDYQIWVSLLTLTALEIVLGIDNLEAVMNLGRLPILRVCHYLASLTRVT